MKRTTVWIMLGMLLLALSGCGGGGTSVPDPDNGNPGGEQNVLGPQAPVDVIGRNTVSVVPGQVNVLSGASDADLSVIARRLGMSLIHRNGRYATLQTPEGMSFEEAQRLLEREYVITSAEPVRRINTARKIFKMQAVNGERAASFTPLDPFYGEQLIGFNGADQTTGDATYTRQYGQAMAMNRMGFDGAWDVSLSTSVSAEPVRIAIIDAGWFDYSTVDRDGFDETLLDAAASGSIDGTGTFTPGLAAAEWDTDIVDVGGGTFFELPFRTDGEIMLGMLAATINDLTIFPVDVNGNTTIDDGEVWNEGIAGMNPTAQYIIIKTGTETGGAWGFTDNEIAEAIDHASTSNADIILLGMFANGAVSGNISTAIQNARDNGAVVVAPAGDVIDSFNGTTFDEAPVDITVNAVTPASDPNVLSVTSTGIERIGDLPDLDADPPGPGPEDIPNPGIGYDPNRINPPFHDPFTVVANYSNTGADIAAVGFGMGFGQHNFLVQGGTGTNGDPFIPTPSDNYGLFLTNFGTTVAATYVAGAASMVFQTLSFVNGTPPTPAEVEAELLSSVQFTPLDGTANGGLLNANAAMTSSINGGNLFDVLPALSFQNISLSQPLSAVTRGTDLELTVTVLNGTAPFELTVDWGNGDPATVIPNWNNGDPVTLTGGYDTLGPKIINVTVSDDASQEVSTGINDDTGLSIFVINPVAAGITVELVDDGTIILPAAMKKSTDYRIRANVTNVFTGSIGGTPNTTTLTWDLDGDGTADPGVTGPTVDITYTFLENSRSFDITLFIEEDVRPGGTFVLPVTVGP